MIGVPTGAAQRLLRIKERPNWPHGALLAGRLSH